MKIRAILVALAAAGVVLGAAPAGAGAASKAKVKVVMTGDCADGDFLAGNDDDNCEIMVTVTPKSRNVSATLEMALDQDDPEWETVEKARTRGGRVIFGLPSTEEDEDGEETAMEGVIGYRVRVTRTAGVTIPQPKEYWVEYVAAEDVDEDDLAMTDEEKAEAAEMDAAISSNKKDICEQQPNQQVYQKDGQSMEKCQRQNQPPQGQGGFDKAGVFNRACGAIGFDKGGCDKLVAAKSPVEAREILGARAEAWCAAIAESVGAKATCAMVLPNVFPPPRG